METKHYTFLAVLILAGILLSCQKSLVNQEPYQKITLQQGDTMINIHITAARITPRPDRTYTWFANNRLYTTEGAYSGHLLDGSYEVLSKTGNLQTSGQYDNGKKVGIWRYFSKGALVRTVDMGREDVEETETRTLFPFFKKQNEADSTEQKSLFGKKVKADTVVVE